MAIKIGNYTVRFYDDGAFSDYKLYVVRNSIGIEGICRARSWEDAYSIAEDEFFPEASETLEELVEEYGFRRESVRDGRGWKTVETPDPDAWMDNELFQEAFGFRPNGPNASDTLKHGIYAHDLNGEAIDELTIELAAHIGITEFDIPEVDSDE